MLTRVSALVALSCFFASNAQASNRSLVSSQQADNRALFLSASHGLPGLDIDIKNLEDMAKNSAYAFKHQTITENDVTIPNTKAALKALATQVESDGTLLFYFTGHGVNGGLYMGDSSIMKISDIREGIEEGRKGLGPVERLVLIYDSCFSGSLVDPVLRRFLPSPEVAAASLADSVVTEFSQREASSYWKNLFVFASSRADETSMASEEGSLFTLALRKAFEETAMANGQMSQFVELTKKYTKGHHPVERFSPETLKFEPLL